MLGNFWLEADYFGVVGDGPVIFLLLKVGPRPEQVGRPVLRVEANGLRTIGDGLVELTLLLAGSADSAGNSSPGTSRAGTHWLAPSLKTMSSCDTAPATAICRSCS